MGVPAMLRLPVRKFTGAASAIALHLLLVALLLRATLAPNHPLPRGSETILYLAPPVHRTIERAAPSTRPAPGRKRKIVYPDYGAILLPAPEASDGSTAPQGLYRQLFDCRPENLSRLTSEQREACARSPSALKPDNSVDFADHTNRSHDAAHWARGRARKDGPLLLPCASNVAIGVGLGTLLCLGKGLVGGFDLDNQPIYGDRPENIHVPNGGDPPPPPNQPDH